MIETFCALLAHGAAGFRDAWVRDWLGDAYEPFSSAGWLRRDAPADKVLCKGCFEQHWLPVEWDEAERRLVAHCTVAGTIEVQEADVAMVSVDIERCLEALQLAFVSRTGRVRELVSGKAWHLGSAVTAGLDWNVIAVVGGLEATDLMLLIDEVARLPRCMLDVMLTDDALPLPDRQLRRPLFVLSPRDVAVVEDGRIVVQREVLERWLRSFLAARQRPAGFGGRPPSKTEWLRQALPELEKQLLACRTDTERHRLVNDAYRAAYGKTISRATVIGVLKESMPDRVRNCQ